MTEAWKWVVGLEGRYEISDLGNVRSYIRKGHEGVPTASKLRPRVDDDYLVARLADVGRKPRARLVHQLVAAAFLGPRPTGLVVRHLNDVKHDNRLTNLAYGTYGQNWDDAVANGLVVSRRERCDRGHEFTPENTYSNAGRRWCKTCRYASAKGYARQQATCPRCGNVMRRDYLKDHARRVHESKEQK